MTTRLENLAVTLENIDGDWQYYHSGGGVMVIRYTGNDDVEYLVSDCEYQDGRFALGTYQLRDGEAESEGPVAWRLSRIDLIRFAVWLAGRTSRGQGGR